MKKLNKKKVNKKDEIMFPDIFFKSLFKIIELREKQKQSGVQGNWIRIQPEKEESFIPQPDSLIQVGTILGVGSKSIYKNNVADKIVVRDWMVERAGINGEKRFYTTDENVLDIL